MLHFEAHPLSVGALGTRAIVQDDRDCHALLAYLITRLGALILAFCILRTHLHLLVEGPRDHIERWLDEALRDYTRYYNVRHGPDDLLLRGPPEFYRPVVDDPQALRRQVFYIHENPAKGVEPFEERFRRMLDHLWSSQRAFSGLCLGRGANVARAQQLLGQYTRMVCGEPLALADLVPAPIPTVPPEVILQAVSECFTLPTWEIAGKKRSPALSLARSVFLRLAGLEQYSQRQMAGYIGRSQPQASKLFSAPVDFHVLQVARTVLRRFTRSNNPDSSKPPSGLKRPQKNQGDSLDGIAPAC